MATENAKYHVVGDDMDVPSEGTWEVIVDDCNTPNSAEIKNRNAAVGTIWLCGGCGDRWKLVLHAKRGTFVGNGQDELQWIRITPQNEEFGE